MKKSLLISLIVTTISLSTLSSYANVDKHKEEIEANVTTEKHDHDQLEGKSDSHAEEKTGEKHNHNQSEGKSDSHAEEKTEIKFSPTQRKQAGIETLIIRSQTLSQQITVPAEILLNQYKTAYVTSKLLAQVKQRFVKLGDQVKKGQKLVVLYAVNTPELAANMIAITHLEASLATAKGEFRTADAEWKRVKSIGKDLISAQRIDEAKITRDQAFAQVQAYQKSQKKMQGLLSTGISRNRRITITAPQAGTIIKDNFVLGQVIDSSDVLFKISDLSRLWVEARVQPNRVNSIQKDSNVNITVNQQNLQGKVININRILDEETKALAVRIELSVASPFLYSGQFVQASINSRDSYTGIAVPNQAILRSPDGDWIVLVESTQGNFEAKEIDVKQNLGDKTVITGIDIGSKIVSKGAFFVQSEIAKNGFEVHNH